MQWQQYIPLLVLSHTQEGLPFWLIFGVVSTNFIQIHGVKRWHIVINNTLRFSFLALYYTNIFNSNLGVWRMRLWENRYFREIYYFLFILRILGTPVIFEILLFYIIIASSPQLLSFPSDSSIYPSSFSFKFRDSFFIYHCYTHMCICTFIFS